MERDLRQEATVLAVRLEGRSSSPPINRLSEGGKAREQLIQSVISAGAVQRGGTAGRYSGGGTAGAVQRGRYSGGGTYSQLSPPNTWMGFMTRRNKNKCTGIRKGIKRLRIAVCSRRGRPTMGLIKLGGLCPMRGKPSVASAASKAPLRDS